MSEFCLTGTWLMGYQNRWIICGCSIPTLSIYTWTHSQFLLLRCVPNSMCRRRKTVLVYTAQPCWYTRPMLGLCSAACLRCLCAVSGSPPYTWPDRVDWHGWCLFPVWERCSIWVRCSISFDMASLCYLHSRCHLLWRRFSLFGEWLLFPLYGLFFT